MNNKKSSAGFRIFGISLLCFIAILLVCEIGVAVVMEVFIEPQYGAYTMTLVIIPVISLTLSIIIAWALYVNYKKSSVLVANIEKIANGDYSAEIEVSKGDSFEDVYVNFNKMVQELRSVKSLREAFVHDLSHEFKTPLVSIHGFAELLMEGGLSEEEQQKFLKIIADEADRLRRLADGVLALSKLENQQLLGESKPFRLDLQLKDSIIQFANDWGKKNIEFSSSLIPLTIRGDESMLRQVWLNLISNAIKFTPDGGKIQISLARENGRAIVKVCDSGMGIPEEELTKIFDKYYRASNAKNKEGNGLGLAVCKRICTLSGGDISAESCGNGAIFKVTLPVAL